MAYLAGANLVESNKCKRLGHHGGSEVLLGKNEGNESRGQEDLREKSHRLDSKGGCGGYS